MSAISASAMEKLLGTTLAGAQGAEKSTIDALSGKEVVGLYFSAHWCPPCKQFTPELARCSFASLDDFLSAPACGPLRKPTSA